MIVQSQERAKQAAARYAASLVQPHTTVGLGTGSTASYLLGYLAERAAAGLIFTGVPTSEATASQAHDLGLATTTLETAPPLDLALDGADEVDPQGNAIKGLGGALLREKMVALSARRFVLMIDESKLVPHLGYRAPVPVEVVPFAWQRTASALRAMGLMPVQRHRADGTPTVTDNGNFVLDCRVPEAATTDWLTVAQRLKLFTGVVDHGLFLRIVTGVVVGQADGTTRYTESMIT